MNTLGGTEPISGGEGCYSIAFFRIPAVPLTRPASRRAVRLSPYDALGARRPSATRSFYFRTASFRVGPTAWSSSDLYARSAYPV